MPKTRSFVPNLSFLDENRPDSEKIGAVSEKIFMIAVNEKGGQLAAFFVIELRYFERSSTRMLRKRMPGPWPQRLMYPFSLNMPGWFRWSTV